MRLFLQSVTTPKQRFEILSFDPVTRTGEVQSVSNPEFPSFSSNLDKDFIKSIGFRVEKVEV